MAKPPNVRGEQPNNPLLSPVFVTPPYSFKRGKVTYAPKAAWGMIDANGRGVDPEQANRVLDETLRD